MTIQTQSTLLKEKVSTRTHTRARQSYYKKINLNKNKNVVRVSPSN